MVENAIRPAKQCCFQMAAEEDVDKDKSRTATGREFQAAGPQTAKLRDP